MRSDAWANARKDLEPGGTVIMTPDVYDLKGLGHWSVAAKLVALTGSAAGLAAITLVVIGTRQTMTCAVAVLLGWVTLALVALWRS
jgi:hypothetical protein